MPTIWENSNVDQLSTLNENGVEPIIRWLVGASSLNINY